MRRIRSRDTAPELLVRRLLFSLGYRYRLHRKDLPGKPDIVFAGRKKAIFVHGCFWHQHADCRGARRPKSNSRYWNTKLAANAARDKDQLTRLAELGWQTLVIWECERDITMLQKRLEAFLGSTKPATHAHRR